MGEANTTAAARVSAEAQTMLDTFASVGASRFDVTRTTKAGDKEWFRRGVSTSELRRALPAMLTAATRAERNLIVRPHGPDVTFLQLDDLGADQLAPLAAPVFLILETSPGNHQAWLALAGREDKEFARRVRRGTGADATASGATRIAGSRNFKDKYAPDYPVVAIRAAQPGRLTNAAELAALGLVAPPEEFAALPPTPPPARVSCNRSWPSYAQALDGAPPDSEGQGPDRSRADFVWCMTAITWGHTIEAVAERLIAESSKARSAGKGYAAKTARNAAAAVERRRRQQPRGGIGPDRG
jgi:hypothetical protein